MIFLSPFRSMRFLVLIFMFLFLNLQAEVLNIVYHIATLNNWEEIVSEQLETLENSGLGSKCSSISVTVVGTDIQRVQEIFQHVSFYEKVKIIFSGDDLHQYEFPGIEMVQKVALRDPSCKILYIHSKGVLHFGSRTEKNVRLWRRYLDYFAIDRWEDCVEALQKVDICGVDWSCSPSGSYFSGNVWWANAEYIRTCKLDHESRWSCEQFIGTGTNPIFKSFHQSGENEYLNKMYPFENFPQYYFSAPAKAYFQNIMNLYEFPYLDEYYRSQPVSLTNASNTKKRKIAVCYFGLTRSVKKVFQNHFENLFDVLEVNNIEYDVFMHTWSLKGKQRLWTSEIDIPIDYEEYKLLRPKYYQLDDQDKFTEALEFEKYFYRDVWQEYGVNQVGEWEPNLILNHLCSLESQKRVTEMVERSANEYDLIMYVRPDVEFSSKLKTLEILDLQDNEIAIPNFAPFEGYTDRFAVLTYKSAPIYGKRIDQIVEFRKEKGRIVSEKYVKYTCDKNNLKLKDMSLYFEIIRP